MKLDHLNREPSTTDSMTSNVFSPTPDNEKDMIIPPSNKDSDSTQ
ncbi:MAG: hypothetical protein ACR2PX_08295 [Endozoicomonas sp.]